jgi:hypothetical protein
MSNLSCSNFKVKGPVESSGTLLENWLIYNKDKQYVARLYGLVNV